MTLPLIRPEAATALFARLQNDITDYCNLRCRFCFNKWDHGKRGTAMTPEIMDKVVSLLPLVRPSAFGFLVSCVYEPTVHPDFTSLLRRIPEAFRPVSFMTTNLARKLDDGEIHGLLSANLNALNISLETLRPDVYKALCGRDRLQTVLANLTRLSQACSGFAAPPAFRFTTMALRSNRDELPELARLCRELFPGASHEFRTPFIYAYMLRDREWFANELMDRNELEEIRERCLEASPGATCIFTSDAEAFSRAVQSMSPQDDTGNIFEAREHAEDRLRQGLLQCDASGLVTIQGPRPEKVDLHTLDEPLAFFAAKRAEQLLQLHAGEAEVTAVSSLQKRLVRAEAGRAVAGLEEVRLENRRALHIRGRFRLTDIAAEADCALVLRRGDEVRICPAKTVRKDQPGAATAHSRGDRLSGFSDFFCYIDQATLPEGRHECILLALLPNARGKGILSPPLAEIDVIL